MKNIIILAVAMLAALTAQAQLFGPPDEIVPKEYWQELNRAGRKEVRQQIKQLEEYRRNNEGQFDFFLEPPLPVPEGRILSGPAWHVDYLRAAEYESKLADMAKGRFCLAVMDTGEPTFGSLRQFIHPGHRSKSYTGEPVPDGHSHSTHIAGSYAHRDGTDHMGVLSGLAEQGLLTFAFYKVCTNGGGCNHSWIAQGIEDYIAFYQKSLRPKGIRGGITLSLGGGSPNFRVTSAIKKALDNGIFVFASSGNNGRPDISYPAEIEGVKAIGAHDKSGRKASFSNWASPSENLYLAGPGVGIYSTCKGDSKCYMSGTSMGNPIANAAVVAVAAVKPDWNTQQVTDHVARYATDLEDEGYDRRTGYGSPVFADIIDGLDGKDEPESPTCEDGIRNGDEEGVDCGGSCPPCEAPPGNPGKEFPERVLQVTLSGTWPVAWTEINSGSTALDMSSALGLTESGDAVLFEQRPEPAAWNWIDITEVLIRVKSTKSAEVAAEEMKSLMNNIWGGNRGVGMAYPADFDKAGRTAAFFTDLLAREYFGGYDIVVEEIGFSNRTGQSMFYTSEDLIQWPRNVPPFGGVPSQYDAVIHPPKDTLKPHPRWRWKIVASWVSEKEITIGGGPLPEYTFTIKDDVGVHETYVISRGKPTRELIEAHPPHNLPWKLGEVVKIHYNIIKKP